MSIQRIKNYILRKLNDYNGFATIGGLVPGCEYPVSKIYKRRHMAALTELQEEGKVSINGTLIQKPV